MKEIVLQPTTNQASDEEQLAYAVEQARKDGYTYIFTPDPLAWKANNHFHYSVTNDGKYRWLNSKKKWVVVFLLSGFDCNGYHICDFGYETYLRIT